MPVTCPHCGREHDELTIECPVTGMIISQASRWIHRTVGGKYRVVELLGEGGMGAVFRAEHIDMGKNVALKLLHEQFVMDADMVERFKREARAPCKVGHDNIIEIHDIGKDETGALFMVMEMLDGVPLDRMIRPEGMDVRLALHLMLQVLSALHAAHDIGILHRDMKPDNVFVTTVAGQENFVKVLDFGIAKMLVGEDRQSLTQTGAVVGTPHYMSPEQATGGDTIDHRTDLYACGVMLYEMLSGKRPFEAPSFPSLMYKILGEDAPALDDSAPALPPGLADVVHRAMARDVTQRYESAAAFSEALVPYADQRSVSLVRTLERAASPARPGNVRETASTLEQHTPVHWSVSGTDRTTPQKITSREGSDGRRRPPTRGVGKALGIVLAIAIAIGLVTTAVLVFPGFPGGEATPSSETSPRPRQPAKEQIEDEREIVKLKASAFASSWSPRYPPGHLTDGLDHTVWTERRGRKSDGQSFGIEFESEAMVHSIGIINGYTKHHDEHGNLYWLNNRLKKVKIAFSSGRTMVVELEELEQMQDIEVDPPERSTRVLVDILEINPGSRWDDNAVAALEATGYLMDP